VRAADGLLHPNEPSSAAQRGHTEVANVDLEHD
jgi:hypothetical protein